MATNGKVADFAHVYNSKKIVIFDLTPTQEDKIDHISETPCRLFRMNVSLGFGPT